MLVNYKVQDTGLPERSLFHHHQVKGLCSNPENNQAVIIALI